MEPSKNPESPREWPPLSSDDHLCSSNQTTKKAVKREASQYSENPETRVTRFGDVEIKLLQLEQSFRTRILDAIDQTLLIERIGSNGIRDTSSRELMEFLTEKAGMQIFSEWMPKWADLSRQVAEFQGIAPELSKMFVDQFVLMGIIREGNSSKVYSAWDFRSDQKTAMKVVSFQNDEARNQFDLEVSFLNDCDHPFIVPLLQAHRIDTEGFIIMPQLEGGTLRQLIKPEHPLPLFSIGEKKGAIGMMAHTAEVVQYLHEEQNLCHNDIKPDNILRGVNGDLHLADFGISSKSGHDPVVPRRANGLELENIYIHGTPKYMAPEKIDGAPGSFAADVYSLGVTYYQLLTGHFPVDGRGISELIVNKLKKPPIPISQYRHDLPQPLANLIMSMLDPAPKKRPSIRTVAYVLKMKKAKWEKDPAVNHAVPVQEGPGTKHMKNMTQFRKELEASSSRHRKNRP